MSETSELPESHTTHKTLWFILFLGMTVAIADVFWLHSLFGTVFAVIIALFSGATLLFKVLARKGAEFLNHYDD